MDLVLRKIRHPQAANNYRVILKLDGAEFEIGSIGLTNVAGPDQVWRWGIDTVIPMSEIESEGGADNRRDGMKRFRAAWERFCADPARLAEFLAIKRKARR